MTPGTAKGRVTGGAEDGESAIGKRIQATGAESAKAPGRNALSGLGETQEGPWD